MVKKRKTREEDESNHAAKENSQTESGNTSSQKSVVFQDESQNESLNQVKFHESQNESKDSSSRETDLERDCFGQSVEKDSGDVSKYGFSQGSFVTEDEHIKNLDKSGALTQVIGSQSMLSQELHGIDQETSRDSFAYMNSQSSFANINSQSSLALMSQTSVNTADFDSQVWARKYGLLSQDDNSAPIAKPPSSAATSMKIDSMETLNSVLPSSQEIAEMSLSQQTESSNRNSAPLLNFPQFGTLLDAVHIFQEQEEVKAKLFSSQDMKDDPVLVRDAKKGKFVSDNSVISSSQSSIPCVSESSSSSGSPVKGSSVENVVAKPSRSPRANRRKKKEVVVTVITESDKVTSKQSKENTEGGRKRKRGAAAAKAAHQEVAQRAARLAERTINEPDLAKRLLLSMALVRENPRSAPSTLPGAGATVPEGFFWAHYPPLEAVLKENMAEYYELSITKCQSVQQQKFNNKLVELVKAKADQQGWVFDGCFTDKSLRDRIRCYYKTHIQNAKKRLRTMVKNPTKRANARHLCAHLDLIEKYGKECPSN